jgi:HAMP domain-containing protein
MTASIIGLIGAVLGIAGLFLKRWLEGEAKTSNRRRTAKQIALEQCASGDLTGAVDTVLRMP